MKDRFIRNHVMTHHSDKKHEPQNNFHRGGERKISEKILPELSLSQIVTRSLLTSYLFLVWMRIRVILYRVRLRQGPYHSQTPLRTHCLYCQRFGSIIYSPMNIIKGPSLFLSRIDIILFFFLYGSIERESIRWSAFKKLSWDII